MLCNVHETIGLYATDSNNGKKLYKLIHPELKAGRAVKLDFSGVKVFASSFFNYAIGELLKDIEVEQFYNLLTAEGLSKRGVEVYDRAVNNAKKYKCDQQSKEAIDYVIEEYANSF